MKTKNKIIFAVMTCILIIVFSIAVSPVTLQNDTYYTIKIGEYIVQNGIGILHNGMDPFSWHEGLPYTFPHWGYDVTIYEIFNIGGFLGIHISTIILACILGLSIYFINSKLTKNSLTSFLITLGTMYILRGFIAARAQLVTFILFIWTIYFIEKYLETRKIKYAIPLVIIPIIIANVHIAVWPFFFVLFLPYIGEYIVACLARVGTPLRKWNIKRLSKKIKIKKLKNKKIKKIQNKIQSYIEKNAIVEKRRQEENKRRYKLIVEKNDAVRGLIIIAIICLFTGLLTPLGSEPYTYLIKTLQGNTMDSISEHLPLTLIQAKDVMIAVGILVVILMFTDTKIKLRDLFMVGGLLFLALSTRRQVSMLVLIGSIILNRLICSFFNKYDPQGSEKVKLFMTKILGIIITTIVVLAISAYIYKPKWDQEIINEKAYPVAACDYILENIDVQNMRIFNEYNYGSYLLFRGIPVFIDSRADLYAPEYNGGQDIFADALNIGNIGVYYEDKFKEYEITHALLYKNSKLNMLLSRDKEKYNELYSDDSFVLYERIISEEE